MQNFIKLFLLASGLAIMLLYPMGNLLLILPPNVVLAPFNYCHHCVADPGCTSALSFRKRFYHSRYWIAELYYFPDL